VVTGDGKGVTGQAGTWMLGQLADRLGIADGLTRTMAGATVRSTAHDRGRVLTQLAMMIAAGGRCVSDLATVRDQPALFGRVASDATAWRTVNTDVDSQRRDGMVEVRQAAVAALADRAGLDTAGEVVIDVDATVLHLHSELKQQAAPTFKRGFGFHPMCAFIEPLGVPVGVLRPGNATANDSADHLTVVDQAIGCLPWSWQTGHLPDDDTTTVGRRVVVRTDTAGGYGKIVTGLAARNLVFYVGLRTSPERVQVVAGLDEDGWRQAYDADGEPRDGAQVREVDELVPSWAPAGTRAIIRRERAHPGASLRLWDHDGWRHQLTLTNDLGDPVNLELTHRQHARVENRIKDLKDTGLGRLPFSSWDANRTWFELVLTAALLLAALRAHIHPDHDLARAEPRRLRYALLAIAARITRGQGRVRLRLDRTWPWTPILLGVHRQLSLPQPC
jgi:hypothetical protein